MQKLVDEGYINTEQQQANETGRAATGNADRKVDVKITDKSIDFLGFKTLKDLLGSLGNRVSARTIRAIWRRASKPAARRSPTNSATR